MSARPASSRGLMASFIVALGMSAGANAQGVVNMPKISAALANQLVGDSVANCAQKNYKVVAVVVDLDGVRQALLRGDE